MPLDIPILYGSYRSHRMGIRLAHYLVAGFAKAGHNAELIDAKAIDLPMLDKRYSDYAPGEAPEAMKALAAKLRAADAFVFVAGEYNRGVQPGLKNLVDHFLVEFERRPAAIASYSAGRLAGTHSNAAWHVTLTGMGMAIIPNTLTVGQIDQALDENALPVGEGGGALERAFPKFAAELTWWSERTKPPAAD
jgi:NAD(P)H-dependent FMN reductase